MKILISVLLLIIVAGGAIGALLLYKYYQQTKAMKAMENEVGMKNQLISLGNQAFGKQLLFIHHSVGSQWLDKGGLRLELLKHGIGVHDATYGDQIGEQTDMCHWTGKFANDMQKIFKFDYHVDGYYSDSLENDIIMFKSCFPNSQIVGDGEKPGDPNSTARLVSNYQATMFSLKEAFRKYPGKIFIFLTAPPLVPNQTTPENGSRARNFSNWTKASFYNQYKQETGIDNFLVFDLFDILADSSNCLKKEYRINENDSHPNPAGLKTATGEFIRFLEEKRIIKRAVQ
jgi:hypothetical protein